MTIIGLGWQDGLQGWAEAGWLLASRGERGCWLLTGICAVLSRCCSGGRGRDGWSEADLVRVSEAADRWNDHIHSYYKPLAQPRNKNYLIEK